MAVWECPKCNRIFIKSEQLHSCVVYPIENHFKNKEYAKEIYNELIRVIKKRVGFFKIESLPCCIHFVTNKAYTFAGVYALKNKVTLHIASSKIPKYQNVKKSFKLSNSRFIYSIDIKNKDEIDDKFVEEIKEAYYYKN